MDLDMNLTNQHIEIDTIGQCISLLLCHNHEERKRILWYLRDRFIDNPPQEKPTVDLLFSEAG